ncbi:hypothetical protein BU17DRAFT_63149 [Hysterangium stoloniferum]|nr:hypothetical protein BU17DRAFT_63149 [Hysterangium stoloniferum]
MTYDTHGGYFYGVLALQLQVDSEMLSVFLEAIYGVSGFNVRFVSPLGTGDFDTMAALLRFSKDFKCSYFYNHSTPAHVIALARETNARIVQGPSISAQAMALCQFVRDDFVQMWPRFILQQKDVKCQNLACQAAWCEIQDMENARILELEQCGGAPEALAELARYAASVTKHSSLCQEDKKLACYRAAIRRQAVWIALPEIFCRSSWDALKARFPGHYSTYILKEGKLVTRWFSAAIPREMTYGAHGKYFDGVSALQLQVGSEMISVFLEAIYGVSGFDMRFVSPLGTVGIDVDGNWWTECDYTRNPNTGAAPSYAVASLYGLLIVEWSYGLMEEICPSFNSKMLFGRPALESMSHALRYPQRSREIVATFERYRLGNSAIKKRASRIGRNEFGGKSCSCVPRTTGAGSALRAFAIDAWEQLNPLGTCGMTSVLVEAMKDTKTQVHFIGKGVGYVNIALAIVKDSGLKNGGQSKRTE